MINDRFKETLSREETWHVYKTAFTMFHESYMILQKYGAEPISRELFFECSAILCDQMMLAGEWLDNKKLVNDTLNNLRRPDDSQTNIDWSI